MATPIDDALNEALDASFEVFAEEVTIGGVDVQAIVTESGLEDAFVHGGIGQAQGKSLTVRKSDMEDAPAKNTECVIRDITLYVDDVQDRMRHWKIAAKDFTVK